MDPTTAALKDLIYALCQRLENRDPSLGWDGVLHNIQQTPTRDLSALALAPESALQEVQNEYNEAIIAAREHHNARLPVNALPPELLTNIFQLGLEDYDWDAPVNHQAVISLVCRHWNRVAVNSPGLWTRWHGAEGLERFKRVQALSKSMGLVLYCDDIHEQTWIQLSAEVGRWQDVYFNLMDDPHNWASSFVRLGKQSAPKLRKLDIFIDWSTTPNRTLDLFDPHDPCRLEDLTLYDVPVVWNALNFEHLRRLRIIELTSMAPSPAELLQILRRNPRLENLCLSGMNLGPETPELSTISQPVPMDSLSSLEVNCHNNSADGLVRMMRFPHCKQIRIPKITASDPGSVSSLTHLMEATRNSIAENETRLAVGYEDFDICTARSPEVQVCVEKQPDLVLNEFINVSFTALAASPAVTLLLQNNFSYDWTMQLISVLARLRSITALKFLGTAHDGKASTCNPLDCLAYVMRQAQYVFPRLGSLQCCVNTVSELESLRQVVLYRHQEFADQENTEILPLEEVDVGHDKEWGLQDRCDAILDEIQALIPGGNLKILSQRWGSGPISWNANWRKDSLTVR
ncbi:hypothetical protein FRC00_010828 [Tulasnella sp. 408]|nr:hypothetical protein FRC00_010828 [Tulasnella sp. 408]